MKKHLRLHTIALGLVALALAVVWYVSDSKAIPAQINTYTACPPQSSTINVWFLSEDSPSGIAQFFNIPFDTGTKTFHIDGQDYVFDNYLRGVLATEIGGPEWNTETLRAKAILARSVVYHRCGNTAYDNPNCGYYASGSSRGVPMHCMQEYIYNKIFTFTPAEQTRYQQAIDFGSDPYITYNNDTFDVKYGSSSHEWTSGSAAPHIGVYDPAGRHHSVRTQEGLSQINANHYAEGENHGNLLPPYDYRRLVGHYFNNIRFVGISPAIPNNHYSYLFNVLHFGQRYGGFSGGYDDRLNDPIIMRQGHTFTFDSIIQNTSSQSWPLFCNNGVALSYHLYTFNSNNPNDKQYLPGVYFEGTRNHLCPSAADGNSLAPGQTFGMVHFCPIPT